MIDVIISADRDWEWDGAMYCDPRVCLSVCLSVCPSAYLKNQNPSYVRCSVVLFTSRRVSVVI